MVFRVVLLFCGIISATLAPIARADGPGTPSNCTLWGAPGLYQPIPLLYLLKNLLNPVWNLADYKTDAQVDRYLGCWLDSDTNFLAYQTKYKKLIQAASDATQIPFSILACLYFYESKFNKNVVSPVGAKGLAQIMPGTWKSMVATLNTANAKVTNPYVVANLEDALKSTSMATRDRNAIAPVIAKIKKLYTENFSNGRMGGKSNLETLRNALIQLDKYPEFAEAGSVPEYRSNVENALDRYEAREMFDRYKEAIGKSELTMDPFAPEAAVIMGALTLKVKVFPGVFGYDVQPGPHDQWVIATGGYNIGPAAMKCSADTTSEECIAITRKRELRRDPSGKRTETSDHMRGIKNCSEHENWNDKKNRPHPEGCQG